MQMDCSVTIGGFPSFQSTFIHSNFILLRPPRRYDFKDWVAVRTANKDHLELWEPRMATHALTLDFFKKRIAYQKQEWGRDHHYSLLIFDQKKGNSIIGGININNVQRGAGQMANLGYWIAESYEGKGYMSQAMAMILHFAKDTLRLHRLNIACLPHNERSRKLAERFGFTEEGFAKTYIKINGKWEDHVLYGKTL